MPRKKRSESAPSDAPLTPQEEARLDRRIRVGYTLIAVALSLGLALCFWPQLIGMRGPGHPLVAAGMVIVALFRAYQTRSSIRRHFAK